LVDEYKLTPVVAIIIIIIIIIIHHHHQAKKKMISLNFPIIFLEKISVVAKVVCKKNRRGLPKIEFSENKKTLCLTRIPAI